VIDYDAIPVTTAVSRKDDLAGPRGSNLRAITSPDVDSGVHSGLVKNGVKPRPEAGRDRSVGRLDKRSCPGARHALAAARSLLECPDLGLDIVRRLLHLVQRLLEGFALFPDLRQKLAAAADVQALLVLLALPSFLEAGCLFGLLVDGPLVLRKLALIGPDPFDEPRIALGHSLREIGPRHIVMDGARPQQYLNIGCFPTLIMLPHAARERSLARLQTPLRRRNALVQQLLLVGEI